MIIQPKSKVSTRSKQTESEATNQQQHNNDKSTTSFLLLSIIHHFGRFCVETQAQAATNPPTTGQFSTHSSSNQSQSPSPSTKSSCSTSKKRSRLKKQQVVDEEDAEEERRRRTLDRRSALQRESSCEETTPPVKRRRRSNFCGNNNRLPPGLPPTKEEEECNTNYKLPPSSADSSATCSKSECCLLHKLLEEIIRGKTHQNTDLASLFLFQLLLRSYTPSLPYTTSGNPSAAGNNYKSRAHEKRASQSAASSATRHRTSNTQQQHNKRKSRSSIDESSLADRMYRGESIPVVPPARSSPDQPPLYNPDNTTTDSAAGNYLFSCGHNRDNTTTTNVEPLYKPHWQNSNANATTTSSRNSGCFKPLKKQTPLSNPCFFPPFKSEHSEEHSSNTPFRSSPVAHEQRYQLREAVEFLKINSNNPAAATSSNTTTTSKRSRRISVNSNRHQCPCRSTSHISDQHQVVTEDTRCSLQPGDDCRVLDSPFDCDKSLIDYRHQHHHHHHRLIPNIHSLPQPATHLKIEGHQILPFISQSSSNNRYSLGCGDPGTSRSTIREKESNHNKQVYSKSPTTTDSRSTDCCDALGIIFGGLCSGQRVPGKNSFFKFLSGNKGNSSFPSSPLKPSLYPETAFNMGCFHSVSSKAKVGPCQTNIHSEVHASIDQSPTIIEEFSPIVLRYRTPYFRANAQVIMPPIRRKETWTVGWIQACDHMKFVNQYGTLGSSSWEIPALKNGKISAVSDSDGVSYPWYGNTTEIATIVGPTDTYKCMHLTMNDNFYPSVTWDIPVSEGTSAHLTRIVRDQSFITWLAAINETTKDIIVLKTVRWNFYLEIDVDPSRELGRRARIVAPRAQKQPLVTPGNGERNRMNGKKRTNFTTTNVTTDNNTNSNSASTSLQSGQIPFSALVRPSANNAQTLIWRPAGGQPVVVVPAKESHSEVTELVLFNGSSAMKGKECVVKTVSKQQAMSFQAQVLSNR